MIHALEDDGKISRDELVFIVTAWIKTQTDNEQIYKILDELAEDTTVDEDEIERVKKTLLCDFFYLIRFIV